jgi:hypothetical protein
MLLQPVWGRVSVWFTAKDDKAVLAQMVKQNVTVL